VNLDAPALDRSSRPTPLFERCGKFLQAVFIKGNLEYGRHALATLAVQSRQSARLLLFNNQLQLCGRRAGGTANPGCATPITATEKQFVSKHENPQIAPDCASSRADLPVTENVQSSTGSVPEVSQDFSRSLHALAFCGIHIISPRLLPMIAEEGTFSIIPTYLRLSAQGRNILAFRADDYYWRDLGRPADLAEAAHDLKQRALRQ